jgi:glycosyltransferase involved in cell wall biosynthesis
MSRQLPSPARPSVFFAVAISPNKIGGIETFAVELARQLDAQGWDLTVCFQADPPPIVEQFLLSPGNVTLAVMKNQPELKLSNTKEFLQLLRRYRPTVLLYTLGGAVRWWPMLARMTGVRRSVYWDGSSRTASMMNYRASKKVKLAMTPLSESICVTKFVKSCSDREEIVPREKSRVIYSAIDNYRELGDGEAFRQRYGIPKDHIVVLKVSWLVPEKGIDLALRAAKQVLNVRKDLQFVFCGDGANRQEYEQLARDLEIADHVKWTGQVENLAGSGAFRAADMQIQCSQWHEAFCLAVGEGMSAGLPVVAARIGGLPELIEPGVNGFLFDPHSETELANAILTLAADGDLRRRMGREGRNRAIENHDLVRNTKLWVETLLRRD